MNKDNFQLEFSAMLGIEEAMKLTSLLIAAGFPKRAGFCLLKHIGIQFYRNQSPKYTEEQKYTFDKYVEDLKDNFSLLNLCRYGSAEHLMSTNPDSNMFHLVPHLPLPPAMKSILLYNISLTLLPAPDQGQSCDSESDYKEDDLEESDAESPDSGSCSHARSDNMFSGLQIHFQF